MCQNQEVAGEIGNNNIGISVTGYIPSFLIRKTLSLEVSSTLIDFLIIQPT